MLKHLLHFTFLIVATTSLAQSTRPSVKAGPIVDGSYSEFSEFLEVIDGKIYLTGSSRNEFLVRRLDERSYRQEYKMEIPKGLTKKWKDEFRYMKAHHGVVDAFYKIFDSDSESYQLKYLRVDKDGNLSDVKLIDEFASDKKKRGGFTHRFSKDRERVVVLGYHPYVEGGRETYTVAVYDWNYNLQWKTEHALPYKFEEFDLKYLNITNAGEVIITGAYNAAGEKGVTMFKLMENDFEELVIDPKVNAFYGMKVKTDVLSGKTQFYSWMTRDDEDGYDGYIMMTIDNENFEIENEEVEEFREELISTLTYEDRQFGKDRPFLDFEFKDVLPKADGGFYLVAEKNYTQVVTTTSGGNESKSYTYYDLDVVVMSVDNSGDVEFLSLVPKFQKVVSGKNYYNKSSYGALVDSKDRLHLFFNDNPENLNFQPGGDRPELMKKPEKCAAMQYTIDSNGKGAKSLFKTNGKEFVPEYRTSLSLGNTLLFVAQVGKRSDIQYYTVTVR